MYKFKNNISINQIIMINSMVFFLSGNFVFDDNK